MKAIPILIIEDESGIALALYKALSKAAYRVDTAKTGASGLRKAAMRQFEVIVLDLGLPDMSGLTICRQLRADGCTAPIIVLTAESNVATKVALFDAGATDYLTKPFSLDELQARIRASLRQTLKTPPVLQIRTTELMLNPANHTIERLGVVIPLRRKEYAIMEYLMQHAGAVVSRASLLNYAWEDSEDGWTNTIDVHIKHLRDKIDRPFAQPLIKTVHGLGYKLDTTKAIAKIP